MNASAPFPLTGAELARIEAEALTSEFEDHRATMDPTSYIDQVRESWLHMGATNATRIAEALERFEANQAATS